MGHARCAAHERRKRVRRTRGGLRHPPRLARPTPSALIATSASPLRTSSLASTLGDFSLTLELSANATGYLTTGLANPSDGRIITHVPTIHAAATFGWMCTIGVIGAASHCSMSPSLKADWVYLCMGNFLQDTIGRLMSLLLQPLQPVLNIAGRAGLLNRKLQATSEIHDGEPMTVAEFIVFMVENFNGGRADGLTQALEAVQDIEQLQEIVDQLVTVYVQCGPPGKITGPGYQHNKPFTVTSSPASRRGPSSGRLGEAAAE